MKLKYIEEVEFLGDFDVVVISKKYGRKLVAQFKSPYLARQFVRKVKRSKKLELVSAPLFY